MSPDPLFPSVERNLRPEVEADWKSIRQLWDIPQGLTYLNHGAFGYVPRVVLEAKAQHFAKMSANPMNAFCFELEDRLLSIRDSLAERIGAGRDDLILCENATYGINLVAASIDLKPGDEVLLTEHEYGAVFNVWRRKCDEAGAKLVTAPLPWPCNSRSRKLAYPGRPPPERAVHLRT